MYNIINAYHFSIKKVLAEFNKVDKDGNLNLDKREFSNLYIKLNGLAPNESTNKIDYIFDAFDKDKNGFLFLFFSKELRLNLNKIIVFVLFK